MSDAPQRKRPWFQLHLSTCVVLMFVAGGFAGANAQPWNMYTFPTRAVVMEVCGWPLPIHVGDNRLLTEEEETKIDFYAVPIHDSYIKITTDDLGNDYSEIPIWRNRAINISVALSILVLTAFACEYWIRRKAGRVRDARIMGP